MVINTKKVAGNLFVMTALSTIGIIYYTYVVKVWIPKGTELFSTRIVLAVFHVLFFMLVWSFF